MAIDTMNRPVVADQVAVASSSAVRQAYQLLHIAFFLLPVIAGLDKFFHLLANWDMYLAPRIAVLSPIPAHQLMLIIGVVEIAAGVIVAFWPRVGAWIVCLWLWAIIINLLVARGFYDIALRDFGLSLCALALARWRLRG
jgi:hypothetical protein